MTLAAGQTGVSNPTATVHQDQSDYRWAAAFLLLMIVEGSFGKWVSPALEYPPVFVRDGVGLMIIYRAIISGRIRQHSGLFAALCAWSLLVVPYSFLQALVHNQGLPIVLIGVRFWVLYLWVTLALCSTLNWADYRRLTHLAARTLLWMLPLLLVQNQAGPDAWINKTATEGAEIFMVAGDVVRTPGTFSFTFGFTCFLAIATPLILTRSEYEADGSAKHWSRHPALGYALVALCAVVSGSRGAMGLSAFMLAVATLSSFMFGTRQALLNLVGGIVAVAGLLALPALMPGTFEAIESRVFAAHAAEDPIERITVTLFGSAGAWSNFTLLGEGLGLSANMSARFAGVQAGEFVLGEVEPERVALAGGVLGLLWIGIKLGVLVLGLLEAFKTCVLHRVTAPLLLWLTTTIILIVWPMSGQLSAHGLGSLALAMAAMSVGVFDRTRT